MYQHSVTDTTMPSDTTDETDEEIRNKGTKQFRKEHPSGFMKLFNQPSMRFVLDALLDRSPAAEFTKSELAEQAGISTETLRKLFPTLKDLGIISQVENTQRYQYQDTAPVSRALVKVSAAANAMALEKNQTAIENIDKYPDTRLSYYCEGCGNRGEYLGEVLTGHILECPNDCMEWTVPVDNPPGSAIRMETTLTDDSELEELRTIAEIGDTENLTPHEQALVSCAFDDDTPPPKFQSQSEN